MATVTGFTAARMLAIEAATVNNAFIDGSSHLIFVKHDGTQIDAGPILTTFPTASDTVKGIVELATSAEVVTGTDTERAVTPKALSDLTANDSRKGLVELATAAETTTGTDDTRAVTPASMAPSMTAVGNRLTNLENVRTQLITTGLAETAPSTSYPFGVSIMDVSGWSLSSGSGGFGNVVTHNLSIYRCEQTFYFPSGGTNMPRAWVRHSNNVDGGGGWTAWREIIMTPPSLTLANDDILQRKSGAWTNRTMAQLNTDLAAVQTLDPTAFNETTAVSSYPVGESYLSFTAAQGTTANWGFGTNKAGTIRTYKQTAATGSQIFVRSHANTTIPEMWFRGGDATGWSAWQQSIQMPNNTLANDDIVQRKSGAWTNRTMAQLATDLAATGEFPNTMYHNGTSYVDADGTNIYVGTVDPGAVPDGSIWLDTQI